jgi:hypothetical protein
LSKPERRQLEELDMGDMEDQDFVEATFVREPLNIGTGTPNTKKTELANSRSSFMK